MGKRFSPVLLHMLGPVVTIAAVPIVPGWPWPEPGLIDPPTGELRGAGEGMGPAEERLYMVGLARALRP